MQQATKEFECKVFIPAAIAANMKSATVVVVCSWFGHIYPAFTLFVIGLNH